MSYQLVLQWPIASFRSFDAMIEVENSLIENFSEANEVDGHDIGSNEFNIFVCTDNPRDAFDEARAILSDHDTWASVRAAYRETTASDYTLLWPPSLVEFEVT